MLLLYHIDVASLRHTDAQSYVVACALDGTAAGRNFSERSLPFYNAAVQVAVKTLATTI